MSVMSQICPAPVGTQPRVLLLEPRQDRARALLGELCGAGIECRYSPDSALGPVAARETSPQLVVLDMEPGSATQELVFAVNREIPAPVVILCEDEATRNAWDNYPLENATFLPARIGIAPLARAIGEQLQRACGGQALFQTEMPAADAQLPPGWGQCRDCGYMGPRQRFANTERVQTHSMRCPACKHSEHITFAVA